MTLVAQVPAETNAAGAFVRQEYSIRDRITADGSSGFLAEPGRYHLYVSMACPGAPDLYPEALRPAIDAINKLVYEDVNNGVYKAGFAASQAAYEVAVDALFARLDWLEARLAQQRFLLGAQLTEADIRLFTTLV